MLCPSRPICETSLFEQERLPPLRHVRRASHRLAEAIASTDLGADRAVDAIQRRDEGPSAGAIRAAIESGATIRLLEAAPDPLRPPAIFALPSALWMLARPY